MEGKRFAGIEVPPDLKRSNFFFLYLNLLLIGILLAIPAMMQPAFLKDIIKVSGDFFGSINGAMQSIGQVAMLLFIGMLGVLSDRIGTKTPGGCRLCRACRFLCAFSLLQYDCLFSAYPV